MLSEEVSEVFSIISNNFTELSEGSNNITNIESKKLFELQSYMFSVINVLSFK